MRPINLTMQAFGAYPDKIEIPFSKLGNLYLINGATGSGKTTIFDAISYALFDCPSGSIREKEYLRSHFASDNVKTFVEYIFLFNGEEYKIFRSPAQTRKKLKGAGCTTDNPQVRLYLPDGKIIEKNEDVKEKINEILGINAQQFSQIALLAQGEFLKLLNSDTETRSKTFRTIFKTREYSDIALKLKEKAAELKNKHSFLKNAILQLVSKILTDNEEILSVKNDYLKFSQLNSFDDFILKIKTENKNDEKRYDILNKNLSDEQKKLVENNEILTKIKTKLELLNKKNEYEKELKILNEQFLPIKNEYSNLTEKNKEKENLKQKINNLKISIEKIERIENEKINLENIRSKKEKSDIIHKELEKKLNKTKEDYLKNSYIKYINTKNSLIQKQREFKDFGLEVEKQKKEYDFWELKYLSLQAGILAKELKENMPCPVCGSYNHPHIAKTVDFDLSKEDLEVLKNNLEKNQKKLSDLSLICAKTAIEAENLKENHEKQKKLFNIEIETEDIFLLEAEDIDFDKKILNIENEIKENQEKIKEYILEITSVNSRISALKNDLKTENFEEVQKEFNQIKEELLDTENEIRETENKYADFNKRIIDLNSKIELLNNQTEALEDFKTDLLGEVEFKVKQAQQNYEKLKLELENISLKKRLNASSIKDIEKKYFEFSEIEKTYKEYKILSDLANGNMANKAKITFEHYMQGYYLDMVLHEANKHLKIMTQNRYELKRKRQADNLVSKTALEMDVMDYYTFKTRSTKTLSGGEAFKAALALALGLSNCISNISGIINIDTLFIDEGFATLDPQSMDLALRVIFNLASSNRRIGIISHVEELKNKIQNQIITIKSQNGSKIELIY